VTRGLRGRALCRELALFSLAALALFSLAPCASAALEDSLPARPEKYVTDRAGVLGAERTQALSLEIEQFERDTSNQVLVWIDRRIPENFTLEDFTVRAAEKWGAGQAATDNGAVLFVFTEDRKVRIETGYGLEGALPDATAKRIIEEEIVPRFRQGDYRGGVESGVRAMMAAAKGEYRGSGSTVRERERGSGGNSLGGCLVPLLFFGVFALLPLLFRRNRRRWRTYGGHGWWTGGSGGLFGGSGGGWSGGGGFSGGGGSFGGGGASGSW